MKQEPPPLPIDQRRRPTAAAPTGSPERHLDSCSFRLATDGIWLTGAHDKRWFVPRGDMHKIVLAWIEWTMQGYWS